MSDNSPITAKALSLLIEERIKGDVVFDLLVEKGIITKKELDEMYTERLVEKHEEYSADAVGLTLEEYRNIVK